jgi:GT2 family glycosyltransferase
MVGPTSNDTGDVATIPARYDSLDGLIAWANRAAGAPREVRKLSLFCAMLRRSAFDAVGGLDTGYGSGMFEDDELCMALGARGFRVLLVPSVFVHHAAGATLRRASPFEYHARFEVNRRRFEERWGVRWRPS